eukprot:comp22532_c0_seq1/m.34211 comp22532_c0_seq1/g.34211  ORF comp22532_c0_seq1/g.34211 comp22532_c0_seq1/m.34211 type:complete len:943 (-) comp22532_c0_seq1:581-3409(-)
MTSRKVSRVLTRTNTRPDIEVNDKPEVDWSLYDFQQNLISILNDPQARKEEKDVYTKDWGAGFTYETQAPPSGLPKITKKNFKSYLSNISQTKVSQFQRNQDFVQQLEERDRQHRAANDGSPTPAARHDHSEVTKEIAQALADVPAVFFHPEFSLEKPEVFDSVMKTGGFAPPPGDADKEDNIPEEQRHVIIREKLSHSLDQVEQQLAHQISKRSDAFFRALKSQQELHKEVQAACQQIASLRQLLKTTDDQVAGHCLKVAQLRRRQSNCVAFYQKLKLVATVHQTQSTIQLLLSTSDFVGALNLIADTKEVLAMDLAGIHSFRHLDSQLSEMERMIAKMMESEFVATASVCAANTSADNAAVTARDKLGALVYGLVRARVLTFMDPYRAALTATIKKNIKQIVSDYVAAIQRIHAGDLAQKQQTVLTEAMRRMDFDTWMELMVQLAAAMTSILENTLAVHETLTDIVLTAATEKRPETGSQNTSDTQITASATGKNTPSGGTSSGQADRSLLTETEIDTLIRESTDAVCGAAEAIHVRITKLLQLRADQTAKVSYEQFLRLHALVADFVAHTDHTVPRAVPGLKGDLISMAKKFFHQYHDRKKSHLLLLLDNERWVQSDVAQEFQSLVDNLEKYSQAPAPANENGAPGHPPTNGIEAISKPAISLVPAAGKMGGSTNGMLEDFDNFLYVDGERFAVVGCVLMFLRILSEYCKIAQTINTLATDVLARMMELLQLFNSRVYQLILGAGALEVAGLKTITAKHLALASQCLSVIQLQLPHLKAALAATLPPKQHLLLADFERIAQDYSAHQSQIVAKIVEIMEGVFDRLVGKNPRFSGELRDDASPYMKSVVKETTKLHKVLLGILPPPQLNMIFGQVFALLNVRFKEAYESVDLRAQDTQRRLTADARYYVDQLGQLDKLKGPGHDLEKYIEDRIAAANRVG